MENEQYYNHDDFLRALMEHLAREIEPMLKAAALAPKLGLYSTIKPERALQRDSRWTFAHILGEGGRSL